MVIKKRCSVSIACRVVALLKSSYYYQRKEDSFEKRLRKKLHVLSRKYPRYGYRRMTALLKREGWPVNKKRIQRLMREEGLKVICKGRKRRRLGLSTAERRQALYRNHVWSWDIVHDRTETGRQLKFLVIVDEYTRQSLKIHAGKHLTSEDVIHELRNIMKTQGVPEHIRSDNGSEFIAKAVSRWLAFYRVKTIYITPGSPWENPYIESFNGKFRDECLNRELFLSILDARVIVEEWRQEYNAERPHSALNYMTPDEFAKSSKPAVALPPLLRIANKANLGA